MVQQKEQLIPKLGLELPMVLLKQLEQQIQALKLVQVQGLALLLLKHQI